MGDRFFFSHINLSLIRVNSGCLGLPVKNLNIVFFSETTKGETSQYFWIGSSLNCANFDPYSFSGTVS